MFSRNFRQRTRLAVGEALAALRDKLTASTVAHPTRHLELTELEERVLMSASPAAVMAPEAVDVALLDPSAAADAASFDDVAATEDAQLNPAGESAAALSADERFKNDQEPRHELVFVDTAAADYQQLVDDLLAQQNDQRMFDVVLLDGSRDGIEQISDALAERGDIDAIHIVSHGTDGQVKLGNVWLSMDNLAVYSGEFANWATSLSADADVLFYGCELASNDDGRDLVEALAILTDADVAASDDNTGHAALGGDWVLEFTVGVVETDVAFSAAVQQTWFSILPNTPPTISLPAGPLNYNASDPLTVIDATATVVDPDSPDFDTGTLTIDFTANSTVSDRLKIDESGDFNLQGSNVRYQPGGPPTTIGTFTGGIDGSTPLVITFNSNATPAIVQELVRSIGYENVSGSPSALPRTVRFVLTDGDGGTSNTETETINIIGGNAAPTINVQSTVVTFNEDDPPLVIDGSLTVSDSDSPNLVGATVSITGGFTSGQDVLDYNGPLATSLGIAGSYNGATGVLTLTGSSSPGNYQQVLRTVTYENTSNNPNTTQRTITFEVDDGSTKNNDARPVDVTASNDAPAAGNNTVNATEDTTYVFTAGTFSYSDPESDPLDRVKITSLESVGSLKLSGGDVTLNQEILVADINAGNLTFDPLPGQSGTPYDSFQFQVHDGSLFSVANYTMTIDVDADNDAPINGVPGAQATPQDTPLTFSTGNGNLVSASDVDAGASNVEVTLNVTNGTVTLDLPFGVATPTGGEFTVNSTTAQTQSRASLASAPDGSFVVVWDGKGGGGESDGVFFQRYNVSGVPQAGQVQVNTTTANVQSDADIAIDDAGNFVVVWTSLGQDNPDLAAGVYGQRFDAVGNALGGEFLVNTKTLKAQDNPSVAMDADGDFVVTWVDQDQDGSNEGVYAQRFNSLGVKQGGEFQVNTETTSKQEAPDVAMDANGNFVITWQSKSQDFGDGQDGVYAQRYDANGNTLGGEFLVNTTTPKAQDTSSIAMDATGNFVIVWSAKDQDGDARGIFGQLFDNTGTAFGPTEFQVNTTISLDQIEPSVAMDGNGDFVVVWQDKSLSPTDVFGQQFDSTGTKVGGEIVVNTTGSGDQLTPAVAMDADGDFVIAWDGEGIGDSVGVHTRQYDVPSNGLAFTTGDGAADTLVVFSGTLANVNAAMDGMIFAPDLGVTGLATIDITVDDLGNTGTGGPLQDMDTVNINVTGGNASPAITSDGGGPTAAVNAAENGTAVTTVTATDPDLDTVTFNITGGVDQANFSINATTGDLTFSAAPDFESPSDFDTDNVYEVQVTADDGNGGTDVQLISVTVTDIASTFIVDTASDILDGNTTSIENLNADNGADGFISLREAIEAANNTAGLDTISFNIAGGGVHTIAVDSTGEGVLPTITDAVVINGYTQGLASANTLAVGNDAILLIELDGNLPGGSDDGLIIGAGGAGSTIRGLVINRFAGDGIEINGGGNNTIAGNFIGTNAAGTLDRGNSLDGILIDNSANNTIGGTAPADRNLISGNNIHGVRIIGAGSTGNALEGNYIGTNAAGSAAFGNSFNGVWIASGGSNNTIGGTAAGAGNVISGNGDTGIEIQDSTSTGNLIQGNLIGTNAAGTAALGNVDGVIIEDAPNNTVGGPTAAARNIISGNFGVGQGNGVVIFGTNATGNLVQNNYIGTDITGTADLGNQRDGVLISDTGDGAVFKGSASNNTIRDNLISGNDNDGIEIENGANNNQILGNLIGTDLTGMLGITNADDGIQIFAGANDNTIGGVGDGNVIAASGDRGISIKDAGTDGNVIRGNFIGTDLSGTLNLGNTTSGVLVLTSAADNIIGGTMPGEGNTIAFSGSDGVELWASAGDGNSIRGNSIHSNTGLGIDLNDDGVTLNDALPLDLDGGPNNLQNFPVLTAAATDAATNVTVSGTINTAAFTDIAIDFFYSTTQDPTTYGEGQVYLGSTSVTTNVTGDATFMNVMLPGTVPVGAFISATATVTTGLDIGNTSEFSLNFVATSTNAAPTITSSSTPSVAENNTAVLTVTATDPDLPAQTISYSLTGGVDQAKFSINATTGVLTFNTAPDFESPSDADANNIYEVQVTADDGNGGSDVQAISVTVTDANDAPIITSGSTPSVAENQTSVLTVTTTDQDVPADSISYALSGGADQASFSINATTGVLTFNVAPDFESPSDADTNNIYEVQVTADDGNGGSNVQSISVTVTDANDAPVITSSSMPIVAENQTAVLTVTSTDEDLPVDTIMHSITGGTDAAHFTINPATGDLTFNTAPDFETPSDADTNNVYEVQVTADDGNGGTDVQAISVTVTDVNDNNPIFTSSNAPSVAENTTGVVTVNATDADLPRQTITYSVTGGADASQFTINGVTGDLSFLLAQDFESPSDADFDNVYEVDVIAADGNGGSDVQSIVVTVTPVNDNLPVVTADSVVVPEGGTATLLSGSGNSVLDNDSDADVPAGMLTTVLDSGPNFATAFALNPDGTFSYTHDSSENFTDSFTYHAHDGVFAGNVVVVSITITPVNDAPVAVDESLTASSGEVITLLDGGASTLLANDSDLDNLPADLSALLVSGPSQGLLALDADGQFRYTAPVAFEGTVTFTYRASDGIDQSNLAAVTIVVNALAPPIGGVGPGSGPFVDPDAVDEPTIEEDRTDEIIDVAVPPLPDPETAPVTFTAPSPTFEPEDDSSLLALVVEFEPQEFFYADAIARQPVIKAPTDDDSAESTPIEVAESVIDTRSIVNDLNELQRDMQLDTTMEDWAAGTLTAVSSTLSVGYILWTIRGGYLAASILTSMPAWRLMDPLPVLEYIGDPTDEDGDDDSLESLLDRARGFLKA